jgi:hypothetical protein
MAQTAGQHKQPRFSLSLLRESFVAAELTVISSCYLINWTRISWTDINGMRDSTLFTVSVNSHSTFSDDVARH